LLYFHPPGHTWWALPLILIIIGMDGVDGHIARQRGETSLLGSVLDIAVDRSVELILWVVFADLNRISILVPIIFITRGVMVDAVRSLGTRQNTPAFSQLGSALSKFLVSSRFMRALYGIVKTGAFTLLTLLLVWQPAVDPYAQFVQVLASVMVWFSLALCIIRGIPPLLEGFSRLSKPDAST
jgi:CDP-diacylglycerol--glycerol-3-phosphate 3-phosphatidyltransferase